MEYIFKDIHSHILPCVDDGAQSMETSLKLLKAVARAGTRELVLTPHYCVRRGFEPDIERILSVMDYLRDSCKTKGIDIVLHSGCEIEYSEDIPNMLKEKKLLTLADTGYILMEFAPYISFRDMTSAVNNIIQLGYIPIIAHIERYIAVRGKLDEIRQLKSIGAKIQVNIGYLSEQGVFVEGFLKQLISNQLIDFVAGDVHYVSYTQKTLKKCASIIQKYSSSDYVDDLFYKNAEEILTNAKEKI